MRWRQCKDPATGKYVLVPVDERARQRDAELGIIVRGPSDAFVSPIDGSVISTDRQYRRHMEEHGVVPAAEFSPEYYERKAKERARLYAGERTKQQELRDKQFINEMFNKYENR